MCGHTGPSAYAPIEPVKDRSHPGGLVSEVGPVSDWIIWRSAMPPDLEHPRVDRPLCGHSGPLAYAPIEPVGDRSYFVFYGFEICTR